MDELIRLATAGGGMGAVGAVSYIVATTVRDLAKSWIASRSADKVTSARRDEALAPILIASYDKSREEWVAQEDALRAQIELERERTMRARDNLTRAESEIMRLRDKLAMALAAAPGNLSRTYAAIDIPDEWERATTRKSAGEGVPGARVVKRSRRDDD